MKVWDILTLFQKYVVKVFVFFSPQNAIVFSHFLYLQLFVKILHFVIATLHEAKFFGNWQSKRIEINGYCG